MKRYLVMTLFSATLLIFIASCNCAKKKAVEETPVEQAAQTVQNAESNEQEELKLELPDEIKTLHAGLSDTVFARIQRTPCFGHCPIYTLTVFKSGFVRYHGEKWVDNVGDYTAKVDAQLLVKLTEQAQKINFFNLKNVYDNERVTDLPATLTTLSNQQGFKTIINRYEGPEELREFENFFDELFKGIEWKKE